MSHILKLQADLKTAWDLVEGEKNVFKQQVALRKYKKKLADYLMQKMFVSEIENSVPK